MPEMLEIVRWIVGFVVALAIGHIVVAFFLARLRARIVSKKPAAERVPAALTGLHERVFFTLLVALDVSGVAPAMMIWLTVKMAANWNRPAPSGPQDASEEERRIAGAMSALLAGLVSMTFAMMGGLICRGVIWYPL